MKRKREVIEAEIVEDKEEKVADSAKEVEIEADATSLEGYVQSMYVRKVIRESHDCSIKDIAMNRICKKMENIVASIGSNFLSVYDNASHGDFLDLKMIYDNSASTDADAGDMNCVCWLDTCHIDEDASLVIGTDSDIQIISITHRKVVAVIPQETVALAVFSDFGDGRSFLLLLDGGQIKKYSIGESYDGIALDWKIDHVGAHALCMSNAGDKMVSAGTDLKVWIFHAAGDAPTGKDVPIKHFLKKERDLVDCVRLVNGEIIFKTVNGILCNVATEKTASIPAYNTAREEEFLLTKFGVNSTGEFVVVGSTDGDVHVYEIKKVRKVKTLEHGRSRVFITAIELSNDDKQILASSAGSMIWRWDYVSKRVIDEFEDAEKERKEASKKIEESVKEWEKRSGQDKDGDVEMAESLPEEDSEAAKDPKSSTE